MRDIERERDRDRQTQAEGEAGSKQEPDAGRDPRSPGSCPGPKAGTQPLSHPGVSRFFSSFPYRYFVIITPIICQRTYDFRKVKIVLSILRAECDSGSDDASFKATK